MVDSAHLPTQPENTPDYGMIMFKYPQFQGKGRKHAKIKVSEQQEK